MKPPNRNLPYSLTRSLLLDTGHAPDRIAKQPWLNLRAQDFPAGGRDCEGFDWPDRKPCQKKSNQLVRSAEGPAPAFAEHGFALVMLHENAASDTLRPTLIDPMDLGKADFVVLQLEAYPFRHPEVLVNEFPEGLRRPSLGR